MDVDPKQAEKKGLTAKRYGKKYYFCSTGCKDKFGSQRKSLLIEVLLSLALIGAAGAAAIAGYMTVFMGIAFLLLAALKLIDLKGFAEMFAKYDLVAQRIKAYAFVYPFIELTLGILFLTSTLITIAAVITLIVMSIGAIGVIKNLLSPNRVRCACLGAKIRVPLTRFTVVEDIVMAIMGLMILIV